ncbi:MAG: hypothetical protein WBX19_10900 [Terracidiphilus sp.]
MPIEREQFVDEATAAAFLAVSIRYLRDLRRAGRVHGHPLNCSGKCRVWRYRLSELEMSLTENATSSTKWTDRRTD